MWNSTEGGSSADRLASPPVQEQQPAETSPTPAAATTAAAVTSSSTAEVAAPRCSCSSSHVSCSTYGGWVEDDPPPYASLVGASAEQSRPPDWSASYSFPRLPYEDGAAAGGAGRSIARPLVSIPLTSYGIFKIEPPRYAAAVRMCPQQPVPRIVPEAGPVVKSSSGSARKYGAILIAATVIVFLMALSLIVRFVTEKSLWRG